METIIILLIASLLLFAVIYTGSKALQESDKDWAKSKEIKEKVNQVSTKEEMESLWKEIFEIKKNIYNQYVRAEISESQAYLKGRYKEILK